MTTLISNLVNVQGASAENSDGTSRQDIIKKLSVGDGLLLKPELVHGTNYWSVSIYTENGNQIGFIPTSSGNKDSNKYKEIRATVFKLTGVGNWYSRILSREIHIEVAIHLYKEELHAN